MVLDHFTVESSFGVESSKTYKKSRDYNAFSNIFVVF